MIKLVSVLFEIVTKLSIPNLKSAAAILVNSGPYVLFRPLIWFVQRRRDNKVSHEKYSVLQEVDFTESSIGAVDVLFIVHLYFPEFVDRFLQGVSKFEQINWKFVVTSSNLQILETVDSFGKSRGLKNLSTMQVPNRGRNIYPLVQALKDHGKNSEVVIHLHSKRSEHAKQKDVESWVKSQWNLLFENGDLVKRVIAIFMAHPEVSIVYPLSRGVLSPWTYTWSSNAKRARRLLKPLGIKVKGSERIAFPAGAMFAARRRDLSFLKRLRLNLDSFPKEAGQLDGELHHVVERLLGYVPEQEGKSHAIYLQTDDAFTTDTTVLTENFEWSSLAAKWEKS
jgi:lipopolysaccharide biosynthesis protein